MKSAYGTLAGSVLNNHGTKIFFAGQSDPETQNYVTAQCGAEQVECGIGGDQFHDRCGVHRQAGIVGDQWGSCIDWLHRDSNAAGGNLRRLERLEDIGRQAIGHAQQGQAGERQGEK